MPNREKVKKALEMCIEDIECSDCPYEEKCFAANDEPYAVPMMRDVLELLKEPEAKQIDLYGNDEWWGLVCVCPDCNAEWMTDKANTHYCPNCGIRVKWE